MKNLIFSFICLLAFSNDFAQTTDSSQFYVNKGMAEMNATRYLAASKTFDKAIALNYSNVEAYVQNGYAYLAMRQTDNAIMIFRKVHELEPRNIVAIKELMELHYNYRQYQKAIDFAKQCTGCSNAEKILAMSNFHMENYGAAVKGLLPVLVRNPDDAEVNYALASSYLENEDNKQAVQYYKKAIQFDGTKNSWMNELGMLYYEMDDYKNAVVYFNMAAANGFQQNETFTENLGYAYLYSGDYQKGEKIMLELSAKKPGNKDIFRDMADAFYKMKMYDKSLEYCQKLLEMDTKDGKALYQAGLCFQKKGQKEKGQAMCDKAIQLDPSLAGLRKKENFNVGL